MDKQSSSDGKTKESRTRVDSANHDELVKDGRGKYQQVVDQTVIDAKKIKDSNKRSKTEEIRNSNFGNDAESVVTEKNFENLRKTPITSAGASIRDTNRHSTSKKTDRVSINRGGFLKQYIIEKPSRQSDAIRNPTPIQKDTGTLNRINTAPTNQERVSITKTSFDKHYITEQPSKENNSPNPIEIPYTSVTQKYTGIPNRSSTSSKNQGRISLIKRSVIRRYIGEKPGREWDSQLSSSRNSKEIPNTSVTQKYTGIPNRSSLIPEKQERVSLNRIPNTSVAQKNIEPSIESSSIPENQQMSLTKRNFMKKYFKEDKPSSEWVSQLSNARNPTETPKENNEPSTGSSSIPENQEMSLSRRSVVKTYLKEDKPSSARVSRLSNVRNSIDMPYLNATQNDTETLNRINTAPTNQGRVSINKTSFGKHYIIEQPSNDKNSPNPIEIPYTSVTEKYTGIPNRSSTSSKNQERISLIKRSVIKRYIREKPGKEWNSQLSSLRNSIEIPNTGVTQKYTGLPNRSSLIPKKQERVSLIRIPSTSVAQKNIEPSIESSSILENQQMSLRRNVMKKYLKEDKPSSESVSQLSNAKNLTATPKENIELSTGSSFTPENQEMSLTRISFIKTYLKEDKRSSASVSRLSNVRNSIDIPYLNSTQNDTGTNVKSAQSIFDMEPSRNNMQESKEMEENIKDPSPVYNTEGPISIKANEHQRAALRNAGSEQNNEKNVNQDTLCVPSTKTDQVTTAGVSDVPKRKSSDETPSNKATPVTKVTAVASNLPIQETSKWNIIKTLYKKMQCDCPSSTIDINSKK